MGTYLGFVALGDTLYGTVVTRNSSNVPVNADSSPTFRVYGSGGSVLTNGTGTASLKDTGSITGATNASPIVITSASHGLNNGTKVTITGVGGNTAANTSAIVANKTSDTFELSGVAGNGAYTSGGSWSVSGLYAFTHACTSNNGFSQGSTYTIIVTFTVSSTTYSEQFSFTVV